MLNAANIYLFGINSPNANIQTGLLASKLVMRHKLKNVNHGVLLDVLVEVSITQFLFHCIGLQKSVNQYINVKHPINDHATMRRNKRTIHNIFSALFFSKYFIKKKRLKLKPLKRSLYKNMSENQFKPFQYIFTLTEMVCYLQISCWVDAQLLMLHQTLADSTEQDFLNKIK